jgi:hypothetical protein
MKSISEHDSTVVTSGELFSDGSVIDLVSSATDSRLDVLFWHKRRKTVAPQVKYSGRVYQAVDLDETLLRAIRFPSNADDYGTTQKLFTGVCNLFERYIGLAHSEAALVTAWSCSTWFPDCLSSPPTLVISGPDMGHAITLFRLLSCLCRRSLVLADPNRSGLLAVTRLRPTLLVNQPREFPKVWDLCGTSNYNGVYVLSNHGRVHNLACSKAFFGGMAAAPSDEAVHFVLPAAQPELPTLDERRQTEIANRFLPQWLMYRLRNFRSVRESRCDLRQLKLPNSELARNLTACIQAEPRLAEVIAPILQQQDQDARARRGCNVSAAIIEVIWAPLHETKEITISRITELTNALLRCRGEVLEYSAEEIGWKVKNLGFYRHRNGSGMVLRFSKEASLRIHEFGQQFGLNLWSTPNCPYCAQREIVVAQ